METTSEDFKDYLKDAEELKENLKLEKIDTAILLMILDGVWEIHSRVND